MSVTATTSSPDNAIASLLRSESRTGSDPLGKVDNPNKPSSRDPVDSVDLSDRAQAILARAKIDQAAADKLAAQVQAAKGNNKWGPSSKTATDDAPKLYDAMSGRKPTTTAVDLSDPDEILGALRAAHTRADGTVESFSKTLVDVFRDAPSTPQEIDDWYNTQGQILIAGAQLFTAEASTGIAQAVQDRTITFTNARDIPDLNLHNTVTYTGGEGGSSQTGQGSYNLNSAIFKDPTTNYRVFDGYVISWKKPEGDASLGVQHVDGPITLNLPPNLTESECRGFCREESYI
jgi:hypothetical protein